MVREVGFMVAAGKYDIKEDGSLSRNVKYASDWIDDLDVAMALLKTCNDYPWSEITYMNQGIWYVVNLTPDRN